MRHSPLFEQVAQTIKPPTPYVGLHLRVEADAVAVSYMGFDDYVNHTLSILKATPQVRTIYVAIGDDVKLKEFADRMSPHGYTVYGKNNFIEQATYASWHFDQRGIIDIAPLVNADYFIGYGKSSMSWVVVREREIKGKESILIQPALPDFTCCF